MFMLFFIESSRKSDLNIHLQTGEALNKPLFALDRMEYKRLWPQYIADMNEWWSTHPKIWHELETDNISITKREIK